MLDASFHLPGERAVDGGPVFVGLHGQGAVDALLRTGHGEARAALVNPLLGEIDLLFGDTDPKDRRKQGNGLAHIRDGHPEVLVEDRLQRVLAALVPLARQRKGDRIELEGKFEGVRYRAVVKTTWRDASTGETVPKTWLMTLFPRRPKRPRK